MTELDFALLDAAAAGDIAAIDRLLVAGANPNTRDILSGYTALHHAATAGHLPAVRILIERGADFGDRRNTVYASPLASAVVAGRLEVVAYLLSKGADPSECLYGDDKTLIDEARDEGHLQIVELLQASLTRAGDDTL